MDDVFGAESVLGAAAADSLLNLISPMTDPVVDIPDQNLETEARRRAGYRHHLSVNGKWTLARTLRASDLSGLVALDLSGTGHRQLDGS